MIESMKLFHGLTHDINAATAFGLLPKNGNFIGLFRACLNIFLRDSKTQETKVKTINGHLIIKPLNLAF